MRRSSATRSSAASCPAQRLRRLGVRKVRQIARPDSDEARPTSSSARAPRFASRFSAPASHRCPRASLRPCDVANEHRGTGLAFHAERPSSLESMTRGRRLTAMAIRLNTALGTGVLAAAALTLACSERHTPLAGVLADVSASPASQTTSYSGRATVLQATVLGLPPVVLADAGPLPPSGGAEDASLLNASVPGLLTAEVLHASTVGQGNASRSEASVAELSLTAAGNTVSAGLLQARASAVCGAGGATATGSSNITALSVNGQTVAISGTPNQRVPLPVGEVIINEQTTNGAGDITVNALHIKVPGVADVIVSSTHADITCQPAPPPPVCTGADFATGGGWITGTPSGAKANFGVAGGIKQGQFWGHLTYIDHGPNGPRVKGTGVTAYKVVNPTTRHIEGTAQVNGQDGFTYQVDVADNGEPGRSDTFTLQLSGGYGASGTLAGGNIQLHVPSCQ